MFPQEPRTLGVFSFLPRHHSWFKKDVRSRGTPENRDEHQYYLQHTGPLFILLFSFALMYHQTVCSCLSSLLQNQNMVTCEILKKVLFYLDCGILSTLIMFNLLLHLLIKAVQIKLLKCSTRKL